MTSSVPADPHALYYDAALREVPVQIASGAVVTVGTGIAFWVENVRAYSTGLTFSTRLVVSSELHQKLELSVGPQIDGFFDPMFDSPAMKFDTWAVADGVRRQSSDGSLHSLGGGAVPRVFFAEWWIPQQDVATLRIGFSWPTPDLAGDADVALTPLYSRPVPIRLDGVS